MSLYQRLLKKVFPKIYWRGSFEYAEWEFFRYSNFRERLKAGNSLEWWENA